MENKILFNYYNHFVIQNDIGDVEVINELGDKFYIRLDDSKTTGSRRLVEMKFEEQLKRNNLLGGIDSLRVCAQVLEMQLRPGGGPTPSLQDDTLQWSLALVTTKRLTITQLDGRA